MPMLHNRDAADPPQPDDRPDLIEPRLWRWSRFRTVSFGVCLTTAALFALALIGDQGRRPALMPGAAIDALGIAWVLSLNVALLAWAHDVIAPRAYLRISRLAEGQREIAAKLEELRAQLAELSESITVYGGDKRQDGYEAALRDTGYRMPAPNVRRGDRPFLLLNNDRVSQRRQSI